MIIKNIYDCDFINYGGHCCLTIAMPYCDFKCGKTLCQNSPLALSPNIEFSNNAIIDIFSKSSLMDAICFQGLEPLDSWEELKSFIVDFRRHFAADIVIYTGYNEDEIEDKIKWLQQQENIVLKVGRYIPNQETHYDAVLKVELASDNQYAIRL